MAEWFKVGPEEEFGEGCKRMLVVEDEPILVVNVGGTLYAISNVCPHAGGRLDGGFVENGRIVCPWHGWSFPVALEDPPNDGLPRYRVRVADGEVEVELPAAEFDRGWR